MSLGDALRPLRTVYLLAHEAPPLREAAVDEVVRAALPSAGLPAFNHSTYRAAEAGLDALLTARTPPLMAEVRLVVVRDLQEGSTSFFSALAEYLIKPSPTTVLVLSGIGYPKVEKGGRRWSTVIDKAVLGAGGFVFNRKATRDPVQFVEEMARRHQKTIDRRTARFLVEVVGPKLGALEREVEKLALYVGQEPAILSEHVEQASSLVAEAVIWDLTTALVARDRKGTLRSLQRLQGDGLDPRQLLGTIGYKLRLVCVAADALAHGASDGDARKLSGLRFDDLRRVKTALREGMQPPHQLLAQLAKANFDMNSHRAGDHRILERLVLDLVL